jgi:adenosine deaminase
MTYALNYRDLKTMARASLDHSFLPGASLWQQSGARREALDTPVAACRIYSSSTCDTFSKSSEKATMEIELEREFARFEAAF